MDSDGLITWNEFNNVATGALTMTADPNSQTPRFVAEATAAWRMADEDTSDELDEREYGLILSVHEPYGLDGDVRALYGDKHHQLGVVETRSAQAICEPGYYCVKGMVRYLLFIL